MASYYAVERSGEYLAHFGVLGMRWGMRKKRLTKKQKDRRKELGYALRSAALSTVMGPAAGMYVTSMRAARGDWPEGPAKKRKKKRKRR